MRHEPEPVEAIRSGRAVVDTVDSYLIHRLTQGSVFATDATNASRALLFDIPRRQWDPVLAEIFEIPTTALAGGAMRLLTPTCFCGPSEPTTVSGKGPLKFSHRCEWQPEAKRSLAETVLL